MVIYEAHVKGLTASNTNIQSQHRGKFLGVCDPWMISHLKRLGVDCIQLMPVFASKGTYWGYDPVSWFRLNPAYGTISEFRTMVSTLHDHGIEVILDVVYNHTADTFEDPVVYYDWNVTGCHNTVDVRNSLRTIINSMDYWLFEVGVDGMRFDLANVMGREGGNFNPCARFFFETEVYINAGKILIAEPWDCAEYSLGRFPSGWLELNGKFRDTVRSGHQYHGSELPSCRSVNFITSHDGFTLQDLVSYNHKHNHDNGEDNRDGEDHNLSWNHGVEGHTTDPNIIRARQEHKRWLVEQLMTSDSAAKMIRAGDECMNSQNGNNNAYCQDNEIGWVTWGDIDYHLFKSPELVTV